MAAAAEEHGLEFEVEWSPFILDPSLPMPPTTIDKVEYLSGRLGGKATLDGMMPVLIKMFEDEGLPALKTRAKRVIQLMATVCSTTRAPFPIRTARKRHSRTPCSPNTSIMGVA